MLVGRKLPRHVFPCNDRPAAKLRGVDKGAVDRERDDLISAVVLEIERADLGDLPRSENDELSHLPHQLSAFGGSALCGCRQAKQVYSYSP